MASGRSSEISQHRVAAALVILSVFAGGMVMLSGPVSAQTVSCDTTVTAGNSIQTAINSAAQGDTICVESGTYAEEVTLNVTGVSLVAADMDNPPVLDGTGLEVGVTIAADEVHVEGFEIRDYGQWGVHSSVSTTYQDVTIRNNTIANNSNGISASKLTNGKVVNNSIVDNEGDYLEDNLGIRVWDSQGIEFRRNNVSNNGHVGIKESSASDNSVIANNTLIGNGVTGIIYQDISSTVTIADNVVAESSNGIQAGSDDVVTNNTVEVSSTGISGATSTKIANNSVTGATTGISLSSASNAVVQDNDVTAAQVGIRVEDTTDTGASDSANVTNNTASGNSVDLWLTGSQGVVVANNTFETGVGLHSDPITREEFVHSFENNTVQGDPLFYATGVDDPSVPATVGQVIVANATNVTVEGHEFDGVAAPIQVYYGDDADIRENTIANDSLEEMALTRRGSISVLESRGALVRDNQITGGTVGETSIHLDGGREVAVVNNTIGDSPAYGIHVGSFGADHEVRENTISGAGEDGIHVTGTVGGQGNLAGVVVADNEVSGSAQYGIHVRAQAQGTKLTGNTVTQNAVQGVRIFDSNDVWIEANDLSQNDGAGLIVEGASANAMIVDNVADANLGPGIYVRPDPDDAFEIPDNVTVRDNEATNNDENDQEFTASFYGIRIEGAQTARVDNNLVTGNDRGGILVKAANDIRVAHNTISDNGDVDPDYPNVRDGTGIHVTDSTTVTVNGNTVTDNPVHGIEVEDGSTDVNVSYNNVEQNVRRGVAVDAATDVSVHHNIVRNNDIGIVVASITAGSSADSVIVSNNLVELNTREGVTVAEAEEVYAEANEFLDNAVGVHLEGATANATLRNNDIAGNTIGINGSNADVVVDARENWWGADNGPSGDVADPATGTLADGDGDPVSENVRFDPWTSEDDSSATPATGGEDWPTFGRDVRNSGFISTAGPVDQVTPSWNVTTGDLVRSPPSVVNGTVYVGSHDDNVRAIDTDTGAVLWNTSVGGNVYTTPAVANGTVYVAVDTVGLIALDADDGSAQWNFPTSSEVYSSATVVNGTVYFGSDDTHLYALDADTGSELWNYSAGNEDAVQTSPAVANGVVYIGTAPITGGAIVAVDATTGSEEWNVPIGAEVTSSPVVVDGTVYVGAQDNNAYALDASTGSQQWSTDVGGSIYGSPAVANNTLYVGSGDNHVYALDADSGSQEWSFQTGDTVWASPAVASSTVYVGSADNRVYALSATSGDERWNFSTDDTVFSSAAVVDGTVYVGSDDNSVYALTGGGVAGSPTFAISIDATNTPVDEGETVTMDVTIENTGGVSGTQTVDLSIDGTVQASSSATLASGATKTVTFSWATSDGDAGDYTATVSSENDSASVSVTIDSTSTGSSSGGSSSTGGAGDTVPSTDTPTPTASPTATPTATPDTTSTETPSPIASSTTTETAEPTPSPTTTETPGQPGFGLAMALLAIVLVASLRFRWRSR